ncbi:MAG: glycosyltransferase, partial [Lachnospiraceae bacterium]|nr:glycosyltransferase [Lachnospiraceae bacterium]
MKQTICLMNDSFPPQLDGVANTVSNYASIIEKKLGHSVVVTPEFPDKHDDRFGFPIIRFPSLDARWFIGYMAGIPFSPNVARQLKGEKVALMHCHCPAAAMVLARQLRSSVDVPVVFTYHTKYDVDIAKAVKSNLLTEGAVRIMIENISACDEVWTVSHGAGENLKSLGYEGDYIVMQNGVDMPLGRVSESEIAAATEGYDLPAGVPVFLFVGRMMWYKGIRIVLDALEGLKSQNTDFRMVFIGG